MATLEPRSNVRVSSFSQNSFAGGNQKLADVQQEPSSSQITLDIDSGAIVVQTKKLSPDSSFIINSPNGTAEIKGTEFQLGISPGGDTKLDVASSSVAFNPTGGETVFVGQGKGLDVSKGGAVNQRPIDPVISVNISTKNTFASKIAGQISLSTVNQAKDKATAIATVTAVGSEGTVASKDSSEQESEESESDSSEAAESFIDQQSEAFRSVPGAQTGSSYLNFILQLANDGENIPGFPPSGGPSSNPPSLTLDKFTLQVLEDGTLKLHLGTDAFDSIQSINLDNQSYQDIFNFLEGNDEWSFTSSYQNDLLAVSLMAFDRIRSEYWDNNDINHALRGALDFSMLFLEDVTIPPTLEFAQASTNYIGSGKVLNADKLVEIYGENDYLYEVGMILAEYGAIGDIGDIGGSDRGKAHDIAVNIFEYLGGTKGTDIPESFSLGDENNNQLISAALLGSTRNDLIDPASNSYGEKGKSDSAEKKQQADSLYKIYRKNIYGVVGADVTIEQDIIDVSNILTKATNFEGDSTDDTDGISNDKKILAFAAAKDLHVKGNVTFKNDNTAEDHALVLGAADHVEIQNGSSIYYEGSNLGIGSYSSLTLNNVDIDVGGNLAIGTLSNMAVNDSTFRVGRYTDRDNVYLYAEDVMKVDGLSFAESPNPDNRFNSGIAREIYMEATTIDLKDVHFPYDSEVMLRSKDGVPKFYGGSYQLSERVPGAVNFYSNSNKYGDATISPSTFYQKGNSGFDSTGQAFTTSTGAPGIKIRKFPD